MNKALIEKLHPKRFPNMSGKMAAIVGHILDIEVTDPIIDALFVTSDGFVLAQHSGNFGANDFIGTFEQVRNNWVRLLNATYDLTPGERHQAEIKFASKVTS
jgi:hypothetical protein